MKNNFLDINIYLIIVKIDLLEKDKKCFYLINFWYINYKTYNKNYETEQKYRKAKLKFIPEFKIIHIIMKKLIMIYIKNVINMWLMWVKNT